MTVSMSPVSPAEVEWRSLTQAEKSGALRCVPSPVREPVRVSVLSDAHIPHHSATLLAKAFDVCRGADHIVIIGDWIDAYTVSDFAKDPQRKESLQDEIDLAVRYLKDLRFQNPNARIDFIEGNHEERLKRYILKRAPAFSGLKEMSIKSLLKLDELQINHHPRAGFKMYGFRFKHGDYVRSKAGATAHQEMTAHRCSGISGHTHRLGKASATDKEGFITTWVEVGCLCDISKADYISAPDWQAGMCQLHIDNDDLRIEVIEF